MRILAAVVFLFFTALPARSSTALRSGQSAVLTRADAGALVITATDHPVLHFVETAGALHAEHGRRDVDVALRGTAGAVI